MIPVFELAKTLHALDRGATLIGCLFTALYKIDYRAESKTRNKENRMKNKVLVYIVVCVRMI
jgi:hypothetical protein